MNFRLSQTDKRYLDDTEKEAFEASGGEGRQAKALSRVKSFRARENYRQNAPVNTTVQTGGGGIGGNPVPNISSLRGSEKRQEEARAKSFRPEDPEI